MKLKTIPFLIILFVLIVALNGCYVEPESDPGNLALNVDFHGQDLVGYAGTGYYMRAKLYESQTIQQMINDEIISISEPYIYYSEGNLQPPENVQSFYIGSVPPNAGIILIIDLATNKKFRILLERVYYDTGDGGYSYISSYAGLTEPFELASGEIKEINMAMYFYS
ncbi:hypothetical protein [Marispirochaeta aestuarii]|uniref:hypothetical protein n=1 Tax=Marispirochaeta aestuarii TaxID=1963862 RepID=UPI0029C787CC|nr:hypothetical protein [Marispirochaeta aestuarii]